MCSWSVDDVCAYLERLTLIGPAAVDYVEVRRKLKQGFAQCKQRYGGQQQYGMISPIAIALRFVGDLSNIGSSAATTRRGTVKPKSMKTSKAMPYPPGSFHCSLMQKLLVGRMIGLKRK